MSVEKHKHSLTVSADGKYRRCTHPGCKYAVPTDRTIIAVSKSVRVQLQKLRKELGFRNLSALFSYIILEQTQGAVIPPADYHVIFDRLETRPVIITGESGEGKTTTVKQLLSEFSGNVFLLDVSDEYRDFKRLDCPGGVYSVNWSKPDQKVRLVPNKEVEISKIEASMIFAKLNFELHSGSLKDWCLVIEEGHRFAQDLQLRALLTEARKFCRKVLLVTTDWRVYEGIAKVFKPKPRETEPGKAERTAPLLLPQ